MSKLQLPSKLHFTYKQKYLADRTFLLMFIEGEDEAGNPIYAYLGIKASVLEAFCQEINSGAVDISQYGKIFRRGCGNLKEEDKAYMENTYFFNHKKINVGILN